MKKKYLGWIIVIIMVLLVFWQSILFHLILRPIIHSRMDNEFDKIPIFSKDGICKNYHYEYNSWTSSFSIRCSFYTSSVMINGTRIKYKEYLENNGWMFDGDSYSINAPQFLTINYKKGLFRLIFKELEVHSGIDSSIDWGVNLFLYYDVNHYVHVYHKLPPIDFNYTDSVKNLDFNRMVLAPRIEDCEINITENNKNKESCYVRVAENTLNDSYCEKLVNNTSKKFECYRSIAFQNGDYSNCKKAGSKGDECYRGVAFRTMDVNICNFIINTPSKEDCVSYIDHMVEIRSS